ncbi:hypothetical protein XENOCAPTIV_018523 [Xenoophorus captivus]|uniref:Uncharacterized protein n=1 Tax=Xenoophorus captivus TaxID=1517983 RepID=A0ABV0QSH3_9TELE
MHMKSKLMIASAFNELHLHNTHTLTIKHSNKPLLSYTIQYRIFVLTLMHLLTLLKMFPMCSFTRALPKSVGLNIDSIKAKASPQTHQKHPTLTLFYKTAHDLNSFRDNSHDLHDFQTHSQLFMMHLTCSVYRMH